MMIEYSVTGNECVMKMGKNFVRAVNTMAGPRFVYVDVVRVLGVGTDAHNVGKQMNIDAIRINVPSFGIKGTRRATFVTVPAKDVWNLIRKSKCGSDVSSWVAHEVLNVKFLKTPFNFMRQEEKKIAEEKPIASEERKKAELSVKEESSHRSVDQVIQKIDAMLMELLELKLCVVKSA